MEVLDAHCHIDILMKHVPDFLTIYRQMELGGITWSYNEEIGSYLAYPSYWDSLDKLCKELTKEGVPFFYLVGIHPRSIPHDLAKERELPQVIKDSLKKHLENPKCLGLGEIGMDTDSAEEEKIFRWQLEWAEEFLPKSKRLGIHTPRNNKERMTEKLLKLLEYYEPLHPFIIIDHVTIKTFDYVHGAGYVTGITLQEGKSSVEELLTLLETRKDRASSIILNSDSAKKLSVPYMEWLRKQGIVEEDLYRGLTFQNAVEFFNINLKEGV